MDAFNGINLKYYVIMYLPIYGKYISMLLIFVRLLSISLRTSNNISSFGKYTFLLYFILINLFAILKLINLIFFFTF